jgi:hypothetical protein
MISILPIISAIKWEINGCNTASSHIGLKSGESGWRNIKYLLINVVSYSLTTTCLFFIRSIVNIHLDIVCIY